MTIKLNPNLKPLPRKDAFALCRELLKEANENENTKPRRREDLERLFLYFAPKAPTKAKKGFDYAARFVATNKDVRYYLRWVYVKNGFMNATNGRIAIRMPTDLADGFYCPKTQQPVDESARYPELEPLIASARQGANQRQSFKYCKETSQIAQSAGLWVLYNPQDSAYAYDVKLLDAIANRGEITLLNPVKGNQATLAVNPQFPDAEILVMPLRR